MSFRDTKNIVLFGTAAIISFFTNCAEELPPGGGSNGGSNRIMQVFPLTQNIANCSSSTARLDQAIIGGGRYIKTCLIFNGAGNCSLPSNFNLIVDPSWSYNSNTDTWSSSIALMNHPTFVPGNYQVHVRSENGQQQRTYTYTIATTNPGSPNTCNAPAGSGVFTANVSPNIADCSNPTSRLTVTVANGGPGVQSCVDVDSATDCSAGRGWATMTPGGDWSYSASNDTWTMSFLTRGPITQPNPGWWVRPVTLNFYFKKTDGTVVGPKTVTIATLAASGTCTP